jgi:hypothetical protein
MQLKIVNEATLSDGRATHKFRVGRVYDSEQIGVDLTNRLLRSGSAVQHVEPVVEAATDPAPASAAQDELVAGPADPTPEQPAADPEPAAPAKTRRRSRTA